MKNCSFYVFYFLFSVLLISCNDKKENPGTLGEKELFFTERLSSISLDSDSAFWIGGETGEVWHVDKGEILPYNISSARIYKIATDAVGADTKSCWIGIRNSGLQKWEFGENVCRLVDRYAIRNKGYNYSVYDILLAGDNVYVATSQGLYAMSRSGKDSLNLIYPSADSETAYSGKPFIVNSIRSYGTGYVLCATQKGLIRINLIDGTIHSSHEEEAIYHVSVYDNKIYLLVDRKLYIEDIDGKVLSEFNLNFSSRIYYKLANIHYFLDETHLFLSENMEKFVSIPLRRKIPLFCNNVMATDKINGYTLLITENALWNIPLHSGILYVSGEIVASCTNGNDIYYVNSNNELFHQRIGSSDAVKVLDFLENEVVSDIMADEEYLYYISNKQILKRIKVGDRYLANSLFASSRVMYESPTKITASYLKRSSEGNSIYLGIQDNLVKINPTGKASLIESLDNKYITSFYAEENSANLYISTLNDGVYYGKDSLFHVIDGTENRTFIRDISAIEAYNPLLLILTNHHLISKEYNDSIPVKGYKKILKVNDTLFYALPEFGLAKYTIDKGKIHEHGRYFRDIRFNPKASFVLDDTLFLGSNIGVMKLGAFSGTSVRWVDLEGSVPSLSMLMVIFFCIVLLLVVIVLEYFRRKHGKRKVLKMHLEDISDRLESLSAISRFTNEADDGEICKLKGLLGEIDLNDTQAPDRIRSLSGIIMKKNRDFALRLSKCLDRQLSVIERYEAFDKVRLVEESHTVQATDNLEQIVAQVEKNENWIQTMNGLEERMTRYRSEMEETVCIEGVNGRFLSEMQTLENNIRAKGLSELKEDIRRMDESYSFIFTDDALELVESYIACNLSKLRELDADKVTDALRVELEHVRTEMNSLDRVKLLKRLYPIDCHASQLFLKARIAEWMEEYVSIRSRVEKENEERISRKFGTQLAMEIADSTLLLTQRIEKHVSVFYESMLNTDRDILNELELANPTNQTAKVLTLLIANPKIKRLYIPGMLGLYGNMNPVISRLVNNKLKVRCDLLKSYVEHHPTSMMFYVLHLID